MSFVSIWLDVITRQTFKLYISNKVIYKASAENINQEKCPKELLGTIVAPLSGDIMRNAFVIYLNRKNEVTLAPVKFAYFDFIKENQAVFKTPIDIRTLYDMIEL